MIWLKKKTYLLLTNQQQESDVVKSWRCHRKRAELRKVHMPTNPRGED